MAKQQLQILDDLIHSDQYQIYESETLLNPQYHMINNTDIDVDKMLEANEQGCFGVTHSDFINCWREFLETLEIDVDIIEQDYIDISKEIDECEQWHKQNGSLYTLI